ncbi:MAG: type II toxin-antitoxin system HicB family antitoxin [bacterium]
MEEIIKATFIKDGDWWIGYSEDVPGALTQGKTLEEAKENLIDAIQLMKKPVKTDIASLTHKQEIKLKINFA